MRSIPRQNLQIADRLIPGKIVTHEKTENPWR